MLKHALQINQELDNYARLEYFRDRIIRKTIFCYLFVVMYIKKTCVKLKYVFLKIQKVDLIILKHIELEFKTVKKFQN